MLGREQIQEILTTLSTNKLRTILTGFAVGWGVLILVILLSSGTGIRNGISQNVASVGMDDVSVDITFQAISIPHNGLPKWHTPTYTRADVENIVRAQDYITAAVPYRQTWGVRIGAGLRSVPQTTMTGVGEAYGSVRRIRLVGDNSRMLNDRDEQECRKVVVLNENVATKLFDEPSRAIGQPVVVGKFTLTVVGVYKGSQGQWDPSYIPLSTMQTLRLYEGEKPPHHISGMIALCPAIKSEGQVSELHTAITRQMASVKGFSPEDTNALSLSSQATTQATMSQVFAGIDTFLWLIGLSTLAIGVVGVINIMQIAVTERRKEIGIRKALGARPRDIISMILAEAVVITLIAGLIGLMVGVCIMAGVDYLMVEMGLGVSQIGDSTAYLFLHPIINIPTAVGTILTMMVGGMLAGYLPARKALRIPTVEAMRH